MKKRITLIITAHQADKILQNIPKGKTIIIKPEALDRILAAVGKGNI